MYTVNRRIRLCEQTSIPSDEPQGWVAGIVHHPVSGWWRGSASTQTFSYYQLSPQPFLAARRDTERIKWGNDFAPASLCIGCIQTTFVIGGASFAHEDVRLGGFHLRMKTFVAGVLVLSLGSLGLLQAGVRPRGPQAVRPNVLVILTDDQQKSSRHDGTPSGGRRGPTSATSTRGGASTTEPMIRVN